MKRRAFLQSMSATIAGGALAPHADGRASIPPSDVHAGAQGQLVDRRARLARHAPVPLEVPDPPPAAAAGFGLRRLRRRFRGGGSPETEGTSSPAMTCG